MKKILTLFAVVGLIAFSSCEGPEGPPGPEGIPGQSVNKVFEILNEDFGFNDDDGFNISGDFNPAIADASTVLVYRLNGTVNASTPIWQLVPRTLYLSNNRELDYDYDFTRFDFKIYAGGNYDLETTPEYLDNQTFRIVIVPGTFTNKSAAKPDYSDYYAVIKRFNIDDSNVKRLN